jgi:Fe2+ transport system protein FeoA
MNPCIPLACCPEGLPVRIEAITGPVAEVHRLRELGFRPGCRLQVLRCGNPCIVQLNGQKLCLRYSPEVQVLVEPEKPLPPPKIHPFRLSFVPWGRFRWRHRGR